MDRREHERGHVDPAGIAVSDETRRRVADKIRGIVYRYGSEFDMVLGDTLLSYDRDDPCGFLADLIEPSPPSSEGEVKTIDRDALLKLADEMKVAAARYESRPAYIDECADCIREACGVEP